MAPVSEPIVPEGLAIALRLDMIISADRKAPTKEYIQ
jgi:hypothetical protein